MNPDTSSPLEQTDSREIGMKRNPERECLQSTILNSCSQGYYGYFLKEDFQSFIYPHHPVSDTGICLRFLRVTRILINSLKKACIWRHVFLAVLNPDCFYLWACIKQRFAAWNLKFPSLFISPLLCLGWLICYISELSSHFLLGDTRSCWTSILCLSNMTVTLRSHFL